MDFIGGRINMETYIAGHSLLIPMGGVALILFIAIPFPLDWSPIIAVGGVAIFMIYNLSLDIRQMHDTGWDGSFSPMTTISSPTQKAQNKWGEVPKPGVDSKALFGI